MNTTAILLFVAGAGAGALVAWLAGRAARARLETTIEQERRASAEKIALLEESEARLADTFKALSGDALKSNNEAFLQLAHSTLERHQESAKNDLEQKRKDVEQVIKPIAESLEKVNTQIAEIEKSRRQDYGGLSANLKTLQEQAVTLGNETRSLGNALRKPMVRGRWGEIQLERVVELAGMQQHCDFLKQVSTDTDGGRLRPDMIIKLPGGKVVVVDAKAPIEAYLSAHDTPDEARAKDLMKDHARHVRNHVSKLAEKSYAKEFEDTADFVVMFIPGENFLAAALEHDPALIEDGVGKRVIIATPTTLIALLRAVAFGWREEQLAENAKVISELGVDLYDRLRTMADHFTGVGTNLERAVGAYNAAIASLETRVLVTARRFPELAVPVNKEIPPLSPVESRPRDLQASDMDGGAVAPGSAAPERPVLRAVPTRPVAGQASMFDAPAADARHEAPGAARTAPRETDR